MNAIKHRAENLNNGGSVTVYYCGFSDASSFCSRFKRCTGMTPKAFILNSRSSSQSSVEGE